MVNVQIKTLSAEKIHHDIQHMLENGNSYIDALAEYARKNNLEIETIAELVKKSQVLKQKIKEEASTLGLMKKEVDVTSKLQF
jgi:hypothetical protein